ncbi:MAG TPA: dihydroorotase, partial [Deinococcales bacterium]|nr:dihydroorotase [Deinococcales bacterium]
MITKIADGTVQDARGSRRADLYLKDGVILGENLDLEADETVDAGGLLVTPAFTDLHVHLREPGQEVKENLETGLAAAVAGGFGTVVSMANTDPAVDEPGLVRSLKEKAERLGLARLRPAATLSVGLKGEKLTDFAALQEAGAVMITDDGIPVEDSHLMRRAAEYVRELGLVIQTHSEDPSLRQDGVMNEGTVSHELGLPGNPASAEAVAIFRDCEVALMTGGRVHIAHVSSERGMRVIEWFKEQGAPVTAEVTPQHLTLTDESLRSFDPVFKVAPPLRTQADVDYLLGAVQRGVVDCIGTDHAPHTRAEKEQDLLQAPFGIANLEVAFPLLYTRLVLPGLLSLERLLELLQGGPARVMGWPEPVLTEGAPADVVLLDLAAPRPVEPETFMSKARFGPWDGEELFGWPVRTFVRGK